MNRREELLQKARQDPEAFVEERLRLEDERLRLQQELTARQEMLAQHQQLLSEQARTLEELHSLVAELKRMLFGPKSEKLTEEQNPRWNVRRSAPRKLRPSGQR